MDALQIIRIRAPQWSTDPRINDLIAYAREITGSDAFGKDAERAVALRVLHILACEAMRGGSPGIGTSSGQGHAGQVTSESEGQLSRSFGQNAQWAFQRYGQLSATIYGQELIELMRGSIMSPMTRASGVEEKLVSSSAFWNPFM